MPNLKYSLGICPEGLRKYKTNFVSDSQYPGRGLNLRPPVYEQERYPLGAFYRLDYGYIYFQCSQLSITKEEENERHILDQ
jgi:hypothetical protein